MKIAPLAALLVGLPLLSACVVEEHHPGRPGRPVVVHNTYEYNDYDDRHDGRRYHCPPGQAKKGRC